MLLEVGTEVRMKAVSAVFSVKDQILLLSVIDLHESNE